MSAIAVAFCVPSVAQAQDQARSFDVAEQPASSGVREFARQAGIQVTLAGRDAEGRKTNRVQGDLDTREALDRLLAGSGLTVVSFDGKAAILGNAQADSDIVVTGGAVTFANNNVTRPMIERQSVLSSVNDVLNELPGVLVTEADAFGSSDAATAISIRGFDTLHIGATIDGIPNGGSRYGGGSKANRYLDVLDLETVNVSQGTADVSSPSNEALAGTINYISSDPLGDPRLRVVLAGGDWDARQAYVRFDTGEIAPGTRAWVSGLSSSVHDWIDGSGQTTRSHIAAKITSQLSRVDLTGYVSFDDANESEYGGSSPANFAKNPLVDTLIGNWVGIPYFDQYYRSGSRALRKNLFGYLKAHTEMGEVNLTLTGYGHRMTGRGDYVPPYLVDVTNDGVGAPNSEYLGGKTVYSAGNLGNIYFVMPNGATATKTPGCVAPAGLPADYAPSCYPANAVPVQSYRHTHYDYSRLGALVSLDWRHDFGGFTNVVRAGTWFEHGRTNTVRDWHKLTDARVSYAFDGQPYWVQYDIDDGAEEFMYYVEDVLTYGRLSGRIGVKQFFIDQQRQERTNTKLHTDMYKQSDPLLSFGLTYATPIEGLELFGGYSKNFAGLQRNLLGGDQRLLDLTEPETARNVELGARYGGRNLQGSLTLYDVNFENRIILVPSTFITGIDYLNQVSGLYLNVGGIKSRGVEAALAYHFPGGFSLSGSYSYNRSKYLGSGNPAQDKAMGVTPGVQVANSPKTMFNIAADWHRNGWKLGVASKYVGNSFIDVAATSEAKHYVVTNGYVGLDLGGIDGLLKGMGITITVNNLTDERYLTGTGRLGTPRTVTAALTLDF
ncbi:MAG: TonB-dependent receptor [Sphingomonas sp.]|uniref:TonB-dependent receptor n=1 Tax=Sphingomonas sp. TaxID=28214 RepID=UPI001B1AF811|nr:TonB-dependent receptor [Sphingomonas sp.]MBO9621232.1 TonB-dependent receptor [Sphingomonas sp.]